MEIPQPSAILVPALALAVLLAGCAGRTDHADPGAPADTSTVASAADQDAAGRDALPAEFPDDVPVVRGTIDAKSMSVPGSAGRIWTVRVTGVDAGANDTAVRLLTDAGFVPAEETASWLGDDCDRDAQLHKDRPDGGSYVARLCGEQTDNGYRLTYTVNIYPANDWQMPGLTPLPTPPPAPEPPR